MLEVIYKDKYLIVCKKPAGVISEDVPGKGRNMPDMVKSVTGAYKVSVVHRLDKPVSGLMVFSINDKATAGLSRAIVEHKFVKEYLAVVSGVPQPVCGEMRDILFRDRSKNKSFVIKSLRKGAKEALLNYETIKTITHKGSEISMVKICLQTGRTHQIRVQFATRGMPILGDDRYGSKEKGCEIALFSHRLAFKHPIFNTDLDFTANPPNTFPWKLFN